MKQLRLFLIAVGFLAVYYQTAWSYQVIHKIPVPGDGGWDYLALDSTARRLYVAHSTKVQVMDVDQEKIIGEIANTPGVHGIALAPELGRGFTSNGKEGTVTIFDLKTLKEISRVEVQGKNPDAILYDSATRHVWTFNGRSLDATVLDAATGKIVGHVALAGKPEFAVADGQGMIYNDLEDKSELLAIDARTLMVKHRWPVAPCEEPSSMAMDRPHHRLFVGCENRQMAVVNADTGQVIATLPIGDHVDATVFDAGQALIFNANGDGTLTLIQEKTPDRYRVVDNVKTQRGARTVALDTKTQRLFLVTAEFGPAPTATAEHPHPRSSILPGTFMLLVVGK